MLKNEVIMKDKNDYLPVFARYEMVIERGEGVKVYDTDGKEYLDFLAGIAVNVLGHNYPPLVKAIGEQAAAVIHCSNLYYTEVQVRAAEKLTRLSQIDEAKVFFANSGAEANEGAIKAARLYGNRQRQGKNEIISATHSFHGRTLATLTLTGQPKYQEGFEPLPAGFKYVTYGDSTELEHAVTENTAAIFLEPIQGEGGVYVPTKEYLAKARELADKYNALLIFDEIQTGIGRTGTFFAYEQFGVTPDIVTVAKGLAGGVPIGAFITSGDVAKVFTAGTHGSTFGGNPLACRAAEVVLDTVAKPEFLANVLDMGDYMKNRLLEIQAKYPELVKEVRGKGLMLGMELTKEGREIVNECLQKGVIINCTAGNVLRFVPPLIITKGDIDTVIAMLLEVLG